MKGPTLHPPGSPLSITVLPYRPMLVRDIMSSNPATCDPSMSVHEISKLMVDHDCGAIPVCDPSDGKRVVGIVTDRDIVCRIVASGKDPRKMVAADCMSQPVATVQETASMEECCRVLEGNQVRRAVVIDREGRCSGMVSQADIARRAPLQETGEVVKVVSGESLGR